MCPTQPENVEPSAEAVQRRIESLETDRLDLHSHLIEVETHLANHEMNVDMLRQLVSIANQNIQDMVLQEENIKRSIAELELRIKEQAERLEFMQNVRTAAIVTCILMFIYVIISTL